MAAVQETSEPDCITDEPAPQQPSMSSPVKDAVEAGQVDVAAAGDARTEVTDAARGDACEQAGDSGQPGPKKGMWQPPSTPSHSLCTHHGVYDLACACSDGHAPYAPPHRRKASPEGAREQAGKQSLVKETAVGEKGAATSDKVATAGGVRETSGFKKKEKKEKKLEPALQAAEGAGMGAPPLPKRERKHKGGGAAAAPAAAEAAGAQEGAKQDVVTESKESSRKDKPFLGSKPRPTPTSKPVVSARQQPRQPPTTGPGGAGAERVPARDVAGENVLIVFEVSMGEQESHRVEYRKGQDFTEVVKSFCRRNNLMDEYAPRLEAYLRARAPPGEEVRAPTCASPCSWSSCQLDCGGAAVVSCCNRCVSPQGSSPGSPTYGRTGRRGWACSEGAASPAPAAVCWQRHCPGSSYTARPAAGALQPCQAEQGAGCHRDPRARGGERRHGHEAGGEKVAVRTARRAAEGPVEGACQQEGGGRRA